MRIRILIAIAVAVLAGSATGLSQQSSSSSRGGAPPVTFAEAIAPIVYANCVTCHRPGEAAPFPLISYEDVAKRGALIANVTEARYMPPWHAAEGWGEFVGERRLTTGQIATIAEWVKRGMPRGDESKMPRLPEFPTDGWRLGKPDLILEMPAAFEVPASGPDVFRNFVIPTGLTEDRWVRAVEYRPSARRAVHHALFAHVPGGSQAARDGADGRPGFGGLGAVGAVNNGSNSQGLGGWAVGATPMFLPDGVASRLPRGSDFLLQLHFHPTGKPESEKSVIGIYFAETAPEKDLFTVGLPTLFGFGAGIDIPPGEKQYTIQDSFTLPGDVRVYSATAHAHYLAKEMKALATLPDGSTKQLLWIDDWDFNWQDSYIYKAPFTLPKGTRIEATITYDNSVDNPRNPITPPRRALWGEESYDEMGTIGFSFEALHKADVRAFEEVLALRVKETIAAGGKNGTLGRFLARQQRQRRGLQQLTIFDRQGAIVARVGEPGSYSQAAFSPDGLRLAAIKSDPDSDTQDVWVFHIATGRGTPVTSDSAPDSAPVWSPDGRYIAYASVRDNTPAIYRRAADGSGSEELLYQHTNGRLIVLTDWSADGRALCFWSGDTMFLVPLDGTRKAIELTGTEFVGRGGRFSPDGRLLAFSSNRSGRFEIYARPVGAPAATGSDPGVPASPGSDPGVTSTQISTAGGIGGIAWRRDGRELFYLSLPPQSVMAVDVSPGSTLSVAESKRLFQLPGGTGAPAQLSSVSSPDGQRFAFAINVGSARR